MFSTSNLSNMDLILIVLLCVVVLIVFYSVVISLVWMHINFIINKVAYSSISTPTKESEHELCMMTFCMSPVCCNCTLCTKMKQMMD